MDSRYLFIIATLLWVPLMIACIYFLCRSSGEIRGAMANFRHRKRALEQLTELQESQARYPLPTVGQLKSPPPERLIAICRKSFSGKDWILLAHGTCLFTAGASNDPPGRSLDDLLEDWKRDGAGMDGGAAFPLDEGQGWIVSCENLPEAISIIVAEELEPNPYPVKITLLGITKRAADYRNPLVIHREG